MRIWGERKKVEKKKKTQLTLTDPTMFGWSRQKYGYSPASVKVFSNGRDEGFMEGQLSAEHSAHEASFDSGLSS